MAEDFLAAFLGNPSRARILRVFALNQAEVFTASHMAKRSGVSRAIIARELKALEKLGIIKKGKMTIRVGGGGRPVAGKQKEQSWTYATDGAYASALSRFVHEVSPMEHKRIIDALRRSGRVSAVILSGNFMGDPTRPADLLIAVDTPNEGKLESAIRGLESLVGREIRYAVFSTPELRYRLTIEDRLIRETLDFPHLILLDKARLL